MRNSTPKIALLASRPAIVRVVFVLGLAVWIPRIATLELPEERGTTGVSGSSSPGALTFALGEAAPLVVPADRGHGHRSTENETTTAPRDELQAIVMNPGRRIAVINGRSVGVGQTVAWQGESWKVDSIDVKCVVLGHEDGVRQIGLIINAGGETDVQPATPDFRRRFRSPAPGLLPHADSNIRRNVLR